MALTPQEIVIELRDCKKDDNDIIDPACVRRLQSRAYEYGNSGTIALKLLDIIKELLCV